ncbi:MAG: hypothetical protein Q7U37_00840 [Gallionella sp.]|nr:hypothetical protein [Gallionella sp.]
MAANSRKFLTLLQRCRDSLLMNESHRLHIRNELNQARGLIPLLMKHRNGEQWSSDERATLLRDLRALSNLSPYLIPLLMPGGIFMLPLVAYWMDRRHKERGHKSCDHNEHEAGKKSA